jgi:hypothetical protein
MAAGCREAVGPSTFGSTPSSTAQKPNQNSAFPQRLKSIGSAAMTEGEWQTRKQGIDTWPLATQPPWKIIPTPSSIVRLITEAIEPPHARN